MWIGVFQLMNTADGGNQNDQFPIGFGYRNGQNGRIGEFISNIVIHQIQIQAYFGEFEKIGIGSPEKKKQK